jgi:3D (Asp-Asp-Asp) domain-containing protein
MPFVPNPTANFVGIKKGVFQMNLKKIWASMLIGWILALHMLVPMASAMSLGERVLNMGASGDDVKQMQRLLIENGLHVNDVDGKFGSETQAAVTAFQEKANVSIDGIAGQETIKALQDRNESGTSRGTIPRYKKVLDIKATAYAPGHEDNGKWGNLTHIGTQVRPGIIAVDPRVIPLRSRVYIEYANGTGVYATAEDTGGAIKGNRIDIAFNTRTEAKTFGIQNVKVYILE